MSSCAGRVCVCISGGGGGEEASNVFRMLNSHRLFLQRSQCARAVVNIISADYSSS